MSQRNFFFCLSVWAAIGAAQTEVFSQAPAFGPISSGTKAAPTTWPARPPARIYVLSFPIEAALQQQLQQQAEATLVPQGPVRKLFAERPRLTDAVTGFDRNAPPGVSIAKQVADSLAQTGLPVVFWDRPDLPPADGWQLRGQIVSLDNGNAIAKNVIGFGAGNAEIAVDVMLADPQTAGGAPFFMLDTSDSGRKVPGTLAIGAVAGFNPYVIAGKVVASRSGISDITQQSRLASEITDCVTEAFRLHGQIPVR